MAIGGVEGHSLSGRSILASRISQASALVLTSITFITVSNVEPMCYVIYEYVRLGAE
jgi:hypothetical protein